MASVAFGLGGLALLPGFPPLPLPGALVFVPAQLLALGALMAAVQGNRPAPAGAWQTITIGLSLIGRASSWLAPD